MTPTRLVAALCLLAAGRAGPAADYHVSPAGDDAAAGTRAAPWRTVGRANRQPLAPGDRLLFEGGREFAGNLVVDAATSATDPANPVTVGSYGPGRATLKAGAGSAVEVRDLGGVVVRDLVLVGDGPAANRGAGVCVHRRLPADARLAGVVVEGVEARGFYWAGVYVGHTLAGPLAPDPGRRAGYERVAVRRCVARGNARAGILLAAAWAGRPAGYAHADVEVADCLAADNRGDPAFTASHSGNGILVSDVERCLVRGSVATGNGGGCRSRTGGPVGIWAFDADRVTIERCESYANRTGCGADGGGFDLDGGVTNSVVQHCYSHDNDGPGFMVWNYPGAPHRLAGNVLRYNVSAGDGRKNGYGGLHVGSDGDPVADLLVHNNTVVARHHGAGGQRAVRVMDGAGANRGLVFANNLLVTDGRVPAVTVPGRAGECRFVGNAYWAAGADLLLEDGEATHRTLAGWRAAAGQERHAGTDTGRALDPRLDPAAAPTVGPGGRLDALAAFRLPADSPLADAGVDLRAALGRAPGRTDFWGGPARPAGIGAHAPRPAPTSPTGGN